MSSLWQHPFVNVFKHFDVAKWKKSSKEGDVATVMDKTLKCTVYRLCGAIPASNYIQLPRTSSQSLNLTGRYIYLLFRPIPTKYFVTHIDVATHDGLVVRLSFSNLFKEFKSTSTWLQFPYVCHAAKGTLCGALGEGSKDHGGPAPLTTRWTLLRLDLQYILSMYLNKRYSYTKSVRLCANMYVKNVFTSDMDYEPGYSFEDLKKSGVDLHGMAPLPRDMSFALSKNTNWHDHYDLIRFPADNAKLPFDSIQYSRQRSQSQRYGQPGFVSPKRMCPKQVDVSRPGMDGVSAINTVTGLEAKQRKKRAHLVTGELPYVNVDSNESMSVTDQDDVHVYAHPRTKSSLEESRKSSLKKISEDGLGEPKISTHRVKLGLTPSVDIEKFKPGPKYTKSLQPDPILRLKRITGFGGATYREALWDHTGCTIVYPCHAVVVAMETQKGHQRFFVGHTEKVSCLALKSDSSVLASGQTGEQSIVRVWRFNSGECLAMFKAHTHSLTCLSFSHSGGSLCGVGKDGHGKTMVVVWNTQRVTRGGDVMVTAKAHTDVDIERLRIYDYDETRMISCGRDNIRVWRLRDGQLRSAPINLGEYRSMEFTDCCFEANLPHSRDPYDKLAYVSSRSGHMFEVNFGKVVIENVRRLIPNAKSMGDSRRDKQTFSSGPGVAINSMAVNETFCVTGSDDGYLRLWPLDFSHVYLEAEHEGPVTTVNLSRDGMKILAGTLMGNLGMLDVTTRKYTTVMRSHTKRITGMALDPKSQHIATISDDHTIRLWDMTTLQQLFDFTCAEERATSIVYHPEKQVLACGFENGCVRAFDINTTSLITEHKQHVGSVTGVAYSVSGQQLYSCCSLGSLALYECSTGVYSVVRLLTNVVARGEQYAPNAIAVSPHGQHVAFVGPSEFTVSVCNAKTLDELMRIDISTMYTNESTRNPVIDTATGVFYSAPNVQQLVVTTSANKLLKLDARSGKMLSEVCNIHRGGCTSLSTTQDGRYLATGGDKVIKVWDYHMRLDLNFQVFIGHSEQISRVVFSPDDLRLFSVGDALFLWQMQTMAEEYHEQVVMEGRNSVKEVKQVSSTKSTDFISTQKSPVRRSLGASFAETPSSPARGPNVSWEAPRSHLPRPHAYSSPHKMAELDTLKGGLTLTNDGSSTARLRKTTDIDSGDMRGLRMLMDELTTFDDMDDNNNNEDGTTEVKTLIGPELPENENANANGYSSDETSTADEADPGCSYESLGASKMLSKHRQPSKPLKTSAVMETSVQPVAEPTVFKHFKRKPVSHQLPQRRYTAPPNQSGLEIHSVFGYNGNGRGNVIWSPDTGLFAYTSGCLVIVEDLSTGEQKHLTGHVEEISTLAVQNDCQVLASASGATGLTESQICLWDLQSMSCKKVLTHHEHDIVCLAYSRDDRFLVSVGDYRDRLVVVWNTDTSTVLTSSRSAQPIHEVKWDPFTMNEFTTVGGGATVKFWLLDETGINAELRVHEASVPADLITPRAAHQSPIEFTSVEYAKDSTVYIGTSHGRVSAWDTKQNTCFMHWEADSMEISFLCVRSGRLLTASAGRILRLWSVVGVSEMRLPGDNTSLRQGGLVMEDEMTVDESVTAIQFDETMDMGVVGTSCNNLWYINWTDRTSIRLVSGHSRQVKCAEFVNNGYYVTGTSDGSVRVWSLQDREITMQFQLVLRSCNCLAIEPVIAKRLIPSETSIISNQSPRTQLPHVVAGYSDGSVRMFNLDKAEMALKMHPHSVAVTALTFSRDGHMILSGALDGRVAISSPTTGMTVRVITDHKGAAITCLDSTRPQPVDPGVTSPLVWLCGSADRRVSIWSSVWSKDRCELVDWLSFPAPAFRPDGRLVTKGESSSSDLPPSIARFSNEEPDIIVYIGYGMQKQVLFYSMSQRKVIRTVALTHWASSLELSPTSSLFAVGIPERLVKLLDYYEGTFQDFVGHNNSVTTLKFSPDGKYLLSVGSTDVIVWNVLV